jgi:hypothetical protein
MLLPKLLLLCLLELCILELKTNDESSGLGHDKGLITCLSLDAIDAESNQNYGYENNAKVNVSFSAHVEA